MTPRSGASARCSPTSPKNILRAVYSERQLQAALTDFRFNHFNVFAGKNLLTDLRGRTPERRDQPHVSDASATCSARLQRVRPRRAIDNALSAAPGTTERPRSQWRPAGGGDGLQQRECARQRRNLTGINENYARELLELHTLGVDGGYTQQDVVAVARAFTGWTVNRPRR